MIFVCDLWFELKSSGKDKGVRIKLVKCRLDFSGNLTYQNCGIIFMAQRPPLKATCWLGVLQVMPVQDLIKGKIKPYFIQRSVV